MVCAVKRFRFGTLRDLSATPIAYKRRTVFYNSGVAHRLGMGCHTPQVHGGSEPLSTIHWLAPRPSLLFFKNARVNVERFEHSQGRGCRQRSCAAVACWSHNPKVHGSCQPGFCNSSLLIASTHPSPIAFHNARLNMVLLYEQSSPRRRF